MALIDETIVEHWLRRQGYFTVRGLAVKAKKPSNKGQKEIDFLAFHPKTRELKHVEVQSSSKLTGILGGGKLQDLKASVGKYIDGKFKDEKVQNRIREFYPEAKNWGGIFVYQKLNRTFEKPGKTEEVERETIRIIRGKGVETVSFSEIFKDFRNEDLEKLPFKFKSEADDLVALFLNTSISEEEEH